VPQWFRVEGQGKECQNGNFKHYKTGSKRFGAIQHAKPRREFVATLITSGCTEKNSASFSRMMFTTVSAGAFETLFLLWTTVGRFMEKETTNSRAPGPGGPFTLIKQRSPFHPSRHVHAEAAGGEMLFEGHSWHKSSLSAKFEPAMLNFPLLQDKHASSL
jgi:hypothetical protein